MVAMMNDPAGEIDKAREAGVPDNAETREHPVAGQPPTWSRKANDFQPLAHRDVETAYGTPEQSHGAATLGQKWKAWRTARRHRRIFKRAYRNYRRYVHPMADAGHSIIDSWYFLVPLGLICLAAIICRAMGWWS